MSHKDHERNRDAWNQLVDLHLHHPDYKTAHVLSGGISLKRIEREVLGDVKGQSLLHLMCQFGLDTLSWARLGAVVTGVDISDMSIKRANELKEKVNLPAEFVRSDLLDLIEILDGSFDIVFQSYGTHIWLSDIRKWARVVAHYLKPGGRFFIIDEHPINVLFQCDPPLDYFKAEPERTPNAADYCDRDFKIQGEMIEWQHPLSNIINALIDAGMVIERLEEYNYGYYRVEKDWQSNDGDYFHPPGGPAKYPIMMSILARKPK